MGSVWLVVGGGVCAVFFVGSNSVQQLCVCNVKSVLWFCIQGPYPLDGEEDPDLINAGEWVRPLIILTCNAVVPFLVHYPTLQGSKL